MPHPHLVTGHLVTGGAGPIGRDSCRGRAIKLTGPGGFPTLETTGVTG